MQGSSSARVLVTALCTLLGVAVFAGASVGSTPYAPHATAPKLIAHDTSSFFPLGHAKKRAWLSGPQALPTRVKARRTVTRRLAASTSLVRNFAAPASVVGASPGGTYVTGDIGHTQYLQFVNTSFAVYSRVGGYLASVSESAFWSGLGGPDAAGLCSTNPLGQPVIAYDRAADRWVVSDAGVSGATYVQCFAVSTSGNAAGTWNRYAFQVSTTVHPDMPSIGVWPDGYYLAFNQLSGSTWAGAGALVVDRQSMLGNPGTEPKARYFDLGSVSPSLGGMRVATQQSANAPDANAPAIYAQAYDDPLDTNDRLELWGFHVDWSAPASGSTFSRLTSLAVNTFTTSAGDYAYTDLNATPPFAYAVPQLGGQLEYYRDGAGTQTLTVADMLSTGVGWYRLTNAGSGWSVAGQGPYAGANAVVGNAPAAAFDGGSVALGYVTSPTKLTYTKPSDATVDDQTIGGTTGTRSLALSLDPLDGCTFWITGPAVAAFAFQSCTPAASSAPVLTADPSWTPGLVQEGAATVTASGATFTGATTQTNQWLLCDLTGLNCTAIAGATATTYVPTATDADGSHTLRFSTSATNAQGTSSAISSPAAAIESILPANTALPVVSGTPQVGGTLATTNGTWTSSSPLHYTYRWQRCLSGTCSNIAGATASSYLVAAGDLGYTIDVVVSATNTGGGVDAASAQTSAVAAAPAPSSGGGSGGGSSGGGSSGGGGGGSMDLSVTGSQSPASPQPGGQVEYSLQVNMLTSASLAQDVRLTVNLPAGVTYTSSQADRGPGCSVSGQTVSCYLDFLSDQARVAHVYVWANVASAPPHTLTATVTAQQAESSTTNNTLTLTDTAAATTSGGSTSTSGVPAGLNGKPTSTTAQDTRKPTVHALATTAKRGTVAKLRYRIYDDRGIAKALTSVRRNGKIVRSQATGYGPVAYGTVYYVGWHVPLHLAKGRYQFCVAAVDRAKNRSGLSCALFVVR